jgi:uncharacterized protein (UPF0261 family)
MQIRRTFEAECGDLVIFHANGVGGAALEEHIDAGHIDGVIDYTLSEIIGHIAGGFHDAGPKRLEAAGRKGPATDRGARMRGLHGVRPSVDRCRISGDRPSYYHNPEFTLVRASLDEQLEAARQIAAKLNASRGRVVLMVPTRGLSVPNCEVDQLGAPGAFWAPDLDAAFRAELKCQLSDSRRVPRD